MRIIDKQHLKRPHMGRLSMTQWLNNKGQHVNIKRVRRLMDLMDLTAIYQAHPTIAHGTGRLREAKAADPVLREALEGSAD